MIYRNFSKFYFLTSIFLSSSSLFSMKKKKEFIEKEFFKAIKQNDHEKVKKFIFSGINLNTFCDHGDTPLIEAIWFADLEMVKILLKAGCDINEQEFDGATPLINAIRSDNDEIAKFLILNGAKINFSESKNISSAFVTAAFYGHKELIEFMISIGEDVNQRDEVGATALIQAAQWNYGEIVKLLIKNRADINIKKTDGYTALSKVCESGEPESIEIVRDLILAGSNINNKIWNQSTPLIIAAKNNHYKIVELLLRFDADINFKNIYDESAYSLGKRFVIVKALIEEKVLQYKDSLFNTIKENNYENFIYYLKRVGSAFIKDNSKNNLLYLVISSFNKNLNNNKKRQNIKIFKKLIFFAPELLIQENNINITPLNLIIFTGKYELLNVLLDLAYTKEQESKKIRKRKRNQF